MNGEGGDILVTQAEWEALLHGARALQSIAADLRDIGAREDAAELDRSAGALHGLVQRATVAAERGERAEHLHAAQPEAER